jgi:hypothetical protein
MKADDRAPSDMSNAARRHTRNFAAGRSGAIGVSAYRRIGEHLAETLRAESAPGGVRSHHIGDTCVRT